MHQNDASLALNIIYCLVYLRTCYWNHDNFSKPRCHSYLRKIDRVRFSGCDNPVFQGVLSYTYICDISILLKEKKRGLKNYIYDNSTTPV